MRFGWWLAALASQVLAASHNDGFREAFVRFPAKLGACPSFEEFRQRGYDRLQAGVVHPLRMLARTQAQAEKARCEELRTGLEQALAQDWSGWSTQEGLVEVGRDSQALAGAAGSEDFDAVHALSLEVTGLDVIRNGNRLEHSATFHVVVRSHRKRDTGRVLERTVAGTGFGSLDRALAELLEKPRGAALAILEGPGFQRLAQVVAVDSSSLWGPTLEVRKGPGSLRSGRRFQVVDSGLANDTWAIAWSRRGQDPLAWTAHLVGGKAPAVGHRLQEIPGDLAWRMGSAWLAGGASQGMELRVGPRLPVGPSVRVGLDATLRAVDFAPSSPPGVPLGWGGGGGVEPDVSFQRNVHRWVFEAGFRPGLRLDLSPVEGGGGTLSQGAGWARRVELDATVHGTVLFAWDPFHALGGGVSWDAFQGRGVWEAPDRSLAWPRGAGRWRMGLTYQFWP